MVDSPLKNRRRLFLARHGEVTYFRPDGGFVDPDAVMLTADGHRQASALREALKGWTFDRVICSGLPRAVDTARAIVGETAIECWPAFREIGCGTPEGHEPRDWLNDFAFSFDLASEPGKRHSGGEAFVAFEGRVLAALDRLLADPAWRTVLIVSHEGVNRLLLGWTCGAPLAGMGCFDQDMGCLNIIDVNGPPGGACRPMIRAANISPLNLAKLGLHATSMERLALQSGWGVAIGDQGLWAGAPPALVAAED